MVFKPNTLTDDAPLKVSPFKRKFATAKSLDDEKFIEEACECLGTFGDGAKLDKTLPMETFFRNSLNVFAHRWKLKDQKSELAFQGLLLLLEYSLSCALANHLYFACFIETLSFHTVFFWKKAVPLLFDSDMQYGTAYRDALLLSLAIYDVSTGQKRLRELFSAVSGLRDSLLGKRAKRFEEAYHQMLVRRMNSGCMLRSEPPLSIVDMLADHCSDDDETANGATGDCDSAVYAGCSGDAPVIDRKISVDTSGSVHTTGTGSPPGSVTTGALATGHFQERVITVSNAPPVSLKKNGDSEWQIGQGSGGLVTCCEPVMNKDPENVWLACFGPSVPFMRSISRSEEVPPPMVTNSLGLPIVKNASSLIHFSLLQDPLNAEDEKEREIRDQMSLLGVFRAYNKENYNLNPVLISDDDYNTYYGGISNGLLWPAFHNLPEYISPDYDQPAILKSHWHAYVRVNYQFAINAVRNSRPQDFLWIHDYHLVLTGMIVQSLDPDLEVGFFLHTPFQPPATFFTKYKPVAEAVLRGILRFTKVGFQTHRDRTTFINFVREHMTTAKILYDSPNDSYSVSQEGFTSSLGVFPVSIKNEEFINLSKDPEVVARSKEIRNSLMQNRTGKLFFSVERFDYTKGIKEKLAAYDRFLERHPERCGKDVLLQIAVINRRGIESYREYQDEAIAYAKQINDKYRLTDDPEWQAMIFKTEGVSRPELVAHYLAMDVGVVTPLKDGMNLVAKEMLVSNERAALILSSGAGTEQQLSKSGFYADSNRCYHRVNDVRNPDEFAQAFYEAAVECSEDASEHGRRLHEFLMTNGIEKWSGSFLDPGWTHQVIQRSDIVTLHDFYHFMFQTRDIRRHIADTVLRGFAIRQHFAMSLRNAQLSLEAACKDEGHHLLVVKVDSSSDRLARLNVADEIKQLQIDLDFLNFVQSDDYDNLEQFLNHLAKYHSAGAGDFYSQVEIASSLIIAGDHYQYFFTDRDGTLKSYACSYASSIQPAYSAVIQGTFAHRCAQYAAILTSAPLLNVGLLDVFVLPDGYFSYGASIGREWYVNATKKFKDDSIDEKNHLLLESVSARIEKLLEQEQFQQFKWIGSGLQKHYGHITVARQDCYGSADESRSLQWFNKILDIVKEIDPTEQRLVVNCGAMDVKIFPKTNSSDEMWTKGDGIRLFAKEMHLNLNEGHILICGDSETDLPMLRECLLINSENVYTVWVTGDESLKQQVQTLCEEHANKNYAFVSCPEVLLGAMASATIREIQLRPVSERSLTRESSRDYS